MKSKSNLLKVDYSKSFNLLDIFIKENSFIRVFNASIQDEEFVWHRDENKRRVKVLYTDGNWKFQHDNCLPFTLKNEDTLLIEKEVYHKLHKGEGLLILHVQEFKE